MPRFITLGTYTNQGAAGLVDGDSQNKKARRTELSYAGECFVINTEL